MNQNEKAAFREILAQRESMYRLLARLYKTEADKDLLDGLGAAGFPEEDGGLGEGFRLIADWLRDPKSEDPVTELAVDYAHTFLGAGIADGLVSYPVRIRLYESRNTRDAGRLGGRLPHLP